MTVIFVENDIVVLLGNGENYIMKSLGIFTPYPILCVW